MNLNKIQAELKAPKNQRNSFGKYNYRSCEDILEAVKPLLGDCICHITDEVVQVGMYNYVRATVHFEDDNGKYYSEGWAQEPTKQPGMSPSQMTGSASSYARKYALNGMFLIDDTKDDDATNKHQKSTKASDGKHKTVPLVDGDPVYEDIVEDGKKMDFGV